MGTTLAALLISIWLIIQSQTPTTSTFTLIIGIAAGALTLVDLIGPRIPRT